MAAGKIFKYSPKKRTRRSSNFKKAVTAIARKTVMKTAETKTAEILTSTAFGVNGYKLDILGNIATGDGSSNRDGDEIRTLGVKIRGYIGQDPAIITAQQDFNAVRMMIVSAKGRLLTTGDMPGYKGTIDPEKMTVLVDKYINFNVNKRQQWFQKYVKFNRKVLYEGGGVNKNELYFWLAPFGGSGLTTTTGNFVNLSFQPYWKDL